MTDLPPTTLECRAHAEALSAAVDGELAAAERSVLDGHLDRCPACRSRYDAYVAWRRRSRLAAAPSVAGLAAHVVTEAGRIADRRRRRRRRIEAAGAAAALLLAAGSIGLARSHRRAEVATARTAAAVEVVEVQVLDEQFATHDLHIVRGTEVRWTNTDLVEHHLVVRTAGGEMSNVLIPRATETVTFDRPGTFAYYCTRHAGMHGTVTVT